MPSNAQRRIVGAFIAIGITLFSLVLIQRFRTTGESIMQLPAFVMASAPINASESYSYDSSKAGIHAFCNVTGPCESCALRKKSSVDTVEDACSATGYIQPMRCTAATDEDAPDHEVRNRIPAGMHGRPNKIESGSEFDGYFPCSISASVDVGLVPFEWGMLVLLLFSLPVVYIRKRGGLDGFRALLPV